MLMTQHTEQSENEIYETRRGGGKQIQSVQRAIDILNCFTATSTALTLGQISERLELNKGTAHGIMNTLRNNGFLSQNQFGQYMLGAELFNKICLAPDTRRRVCIDRGHSLLQSLSNAFHTNGTLFAAEGTEMIVLDTTEPTNCAFIIRRATSAIAMHASASGKLVLSSLPGKELEAYLSKAPFPALTDTTKTTRQQLLKEFATIRDHGYSYENDELFSGISAISVPIFNQYGAQLFGTVSLTGISTGIRKQKAEIVQALKSVAKRLQEDLQF